MVVIRQTGLFHTGGDVWVLAIKKVTQADAGVYICEVNSNPVIRSLHVLNGVSARSSVESIVFCLYKRPNNHFFLSQWPTRIQHHRSSRQKWRTTTQIVVNSWTYPAPVSIFVVWAVLWMVPSPWTLINVIVTSQTSSNAWPVIHAGLDQMDQL